MGVRKLENSRFHMIFYTRENEADFNHFKSSVELLIDDRKLNKDVVLDFTGTEIVLPAELTLISKSLLRMEAIRRKLSLILSPANLKKIEALKMSKSSGIKLYAERGAFLGEYTGS